MRREYSMRIAVLALAGVVSLHGQESRLNFNMGGGVGAPLNPTAGYAGVGGNFVAGIGYNFDEHNALVGQYMWHGLPPTVGIRTQLLGGDASSNLNALTVNFRHARQFNHTWGFYLMGGGGWYYRHSTISWSPITTQQTPVVCSPVYNWYGYSCSGGYVVGVGVSASAGTSSLGGNAGLGLTLRLSESNWKFYIESRYAYAGSARVSTQVAPVTFGLMYH